MSLNKLQEIAKDRETWRAAVHGVTESDMTEQLNKLTDWVWSHLPGAKRFCKTVLLDSISRQYF